MPKNQGLYKTFASTFQKGPPDGTAVLSPNKLDNQSFRIQVWQFVFFDIIWVATLLVILVIAFSFWMI